MRHDEEADFFSAKGLCRCGCGMKAPIAKANKRSVGHVKGKPVHYIKGHQNFERARDPIAEFNANSYPDPNTGCFIWDGGYRSDGYATFSVRGRTMLAARFAWESQFGAIPDGLEVMHLCHNRWCVSADHLKIGPHAENMSHIVLANRGRRGSLPRGVKKQSGSRGWVARACLPGGKGKTVYLGTFPTIEEAASVAAAKRAELIAAYKASMI